MSELEQRVSPSATPVVEGVELIRLAVEGWKKTVDVQQHFNDLELRIRNFAITFITAVLGFVGLALKDGNKSILPAGLFWIGTLGWFGFYFMDRHWYHRFLEAAVDHGRAVEGWLRTATGTEVFSLASGIKQASGIPLLRDRKLRSRHRLDLFYGGFWLAFAVLFAVFYAHSTK